MYTPVLTYIHAPHGCAMYCSLIALIASPFYFMLRMYCYSMSNGGTEPAILLVDNGPAHLAPSESIPWKSGKFFGYTLSNALVIFFQPNCTSKAQPLDACCIQSAKAIYRKRHMCWVLEQLSDGDDDNTSELRCTLR